MKHKKTLLCSLLLISCLILVTSMPVFAAELTEAEVQQAVDAQGKETVTGNVFIWFLCAIAFLKVSQKSTALWQVWESTLEILVEI